MDVTVTVALACFGAMMGWYIMDFLRQRLRRRVLNAIPESGETTPLEIHRATGVSLGSIYVALDHWVDYGVIDQRYEMGGVERGFRSKRFVRRTNS